jgi:hypothetical protein
VPGSPPADDRRLPGYNDVAVRPAIDIDRAGDPDATEAEHTHPYFARIVFPETPTAPAGDQFLDVPLRCIMSPPREHHPYEPRGE